MSPDSRTHARGRLARMSDLWGVDVQEIELTRSSLIAFGKRDDASVVLKVARRRHDEWDAGAVISAFGGAGMVRALEHVPGAVLLERLTPGDPLVKRVREGRADEALNVLASVIGAMRAVAPELEGRPTALDWGAGFGRYGSRFSARGLLPAELVEVGRDVYDRLCRTQGPVRLLHGDLQHYNVLADRRRGWLAIDPKGVVAEAEFEPGAALRNPAGMPELHTTEALRKRAEKLSNALGLDLSRVLGWTFAQSVLSAIWMIEDGESPEAYARAVAIARAARPLVANHT